MLMNTQ